MRILLSLFVLFTTSIASGQQLHVKPDFAVQYISYFGIGSKSVQQPTVIGYNAANYALMQEKLPEWTDQGLGIPFSFYKEIMESSGANEFVKKIKTSRANLDEKELILALNNIRSKIEKASVPKALSNQLKNAIDEFYKGKKIRLSCSPNYLTNKTFSVLSSTSTKELSKSILQIYASFWQLDIAKARLYDQTWDKKQPAVGILITQGFEFGYAIGRAQTDYTAKEPSIKILSKRETSTERITFPRFDSKWYRVNQKAEESPVFVNNAALTPTVRDLQKAMVLLNPILRKGIYPLKSLTDQNYKTVFTFIIKKNNAGFTLKLQQPELLWIEKD